MHLLDRKRCTLRAGQYFTAGEQEYELGGKIGDGAVGLVRKARNRETYRMVAVKLLAPDPKYIDPEAFDDVAQRFRHEGVRGAGLEHKNLVEILAYEENGDGKAFRSESVKNPFLVMEIVRGKTLKTLIRNLSRKDEGVHITVQTLSISSRVARALEYLHRRDGLLSGAKPKC